MILISYATIVFFLLRVEGWNDRFFGRDGSKDEFSMIWPDLNLTNRNRSVHTVQIEFGVEKERKFFPLSISAFITANLKILS